MRYSWLQMASLAGAALAALSTSAVCQQPSAPATWTAVEAALGRKGALQSGNVMKFSFPRSDLSVSVGGVTLKPALALGGRVAFKEVQPGRGMAIGGLVLAEDEMSSVMRALQGGGSRSHGLQHALVNQTAADHH